MSEPKKKRKSSYQIALEKGLTQTSVRFTPEQTEVIKEAAIADGRTWTAFIAHYAHLAAKNVIEAKKPAQ